MAKHPPASAGDIRDVGSIPGLGRSLGGGHGNPPQYSCLENPHGQRSLVGYSPWSHKRVGHNLVTKWQHENIKKQEDSRNATELGMRINCVLWQFPNMSHWPIALHPSGLLAPPLPPQPWEMWPISSSTGRSSLKSWSFAALNSMY